METPFDLPDAFEQIDSPFDLDSGDRVTVIEGSPSEGGEVVLEDAELEDISKGGFGGEPVFEFADRPQGSETTIAGDMITEATEGGPRDRTAFRRQPAVSESAFSSEAKARAETAHNARSERAQATDEALNAPVADSLEAWLSDKDGLDFPGVDR